MNQVDRSSKTASIKILAHTPQEALAVVRALGRVLPGVKITSGVRPSDRSQSTSTRFDFEFFCFVLVPFELTAAGEARPTQKNAVLAFKEGRAP